MRIRANMGPQVNAISYNSYAPVIKGWGFDDAITNGANVSAMVSVSQEIAGKKNKQNRYDALTLQNQSAQNTGKISEQDLKKNVASQYIISYGDWQQYIFNAEVLELYNKEEKILRALTEKGVYKQTDYLSFLVNVQQQKIAVERFKNQYTNDFTELNFLCGIEDTAFIELLDPKLMAAILPDFKNSIFYAQFAIDSLKLQNSDKQIDFSYKPKISVIADGGYLSSLAYKPGKNLGVDVGISVSVPIYDGHQRKMQYSRIVIEEQTRRNYQDYYSVQYRQQTRRLFQQLTANEKLLEQISSQIAYTQSLIDANHKLLETGDISITDYILSVNVYLNAKNLMIDNTISKYQIINEINYWNRTK
jgi:outer membrane protein TolC